MNPSEHTRLPPGALEDGASRVTFPTGMPTSSSSSNSTTPARHEDPATYWVEYRGQRFRVNPQVIRHFYPTQYQAINRGTTYQQGVRITPMSSMGPPSPSSQRLPSPPPFPEVQIGPKSPGITAPGDGSTEADNTAKYDQQAGRRIRPGTKAADMARGPPFIPLSELDSPFQLQEYVKSLWYHNTRSPNSPMTTVPLTHETALQIVTPPPGVDKSLWLYELCRWSVIKANDFITAFFREAPPCSATTCPEMRASEWQYLCAVHEPPKPCCAIDYCCHTLDWAGDTLSSNKNFPSRLTSGNGATGGTTTAVKILTNIMRRVYRIFAHAWFQHRSVFWQVEGKEGFYIYFKTICDVYALIPEDNYTIPPEAEGLAAKEEESQASKALPKKPQHPDDEAATTKEADTTTLVSTGATTRRHKHTPSVGSTVTTIQEGDEEDNGASESAKENGPLDTLASSLIKEAPLAQISKTAEAKEDSPAAVEQNPIAAAQNAQDEPTLTSTKESDQHDDQATSQADAPEKVEFNKEEDAVEAHDAKGETAPAALEAPAAAEEAEKESEKEG